MTNASKKWPDTDRPQRRQGGSNAACVLRVAESLKARDVRFARVVTSINYGRTWVEIISTPAGPEVFLKTLFG